MIRIFKTFVFFAGGLLAGPAALAQPVMADALDKLVVKPYSAYFGAKKEVFYIQANKAVLLAGEPLAFKVYVSDARHRKPFLETANIYIELFGPGGETVAQQILYAEGGSAPGLLQLPATLKSGTYWLRAYTAWSRNFAEADPGTLPLQVLGKEGAPAGKPLPAGDPGLGLFAEGGSFIEEVPTRFGMKLSAPDGSGMASVVDVTINGRPYRSVATNELGFASLTLSACADDSIVASWALPGGGRKTLSFPKPLERGLGLSVRGRATGAPIVVSVSTNKRFLEELGEQKFYLLLHRQGTVHKLHWISFVNKRTSIELSFPASDLPEGVHHVTLFGPDFRPVADRAVFVTTPAPAPKVAASLSKWKDSIRVTVTTTNGAGAPVAANLGMSFLPAGTRCDGFRSALFARHLLEQEVQGFIERPLYYFGVRDTVRAAELDELLLVQGWRGYDWNAILNGGERPLPFPFEQGFSVRGRLAGRATGKGKGDRALILANPRQQLFLKGPVDSSGAFRFDRIFLQDPAKLSLLAPDARSAARYRNIVIDSPLYYFIPARPLLPAPAPIAATGTGLGILGDELPEVIVNKPRQSQWAIADELRPLRERTYRFSDKDRARYQTLMDYLKTHYNLREYNRRDPVTNADDYHLTFSLTNSLTLPSDPVLIIDGGPVSDLQLLGRLSLQDIESVSVNTRGSTDVPFGSGGHIIVKTRSPLDDAGPQTASNVVLEWMLQGYRLPADYYRPAYRMTPGTAAFEDYAALFWVPEIHTDSTGTCSFLIPNPEHRTELKFLVEGKGDGGECFYGHQRAVIKQ